ncbi:electrogenic aspartate/glutamate antiporter SLC25A13, mitochondrial-like [Sycon ciliatum]|uniref:electrogenic aspartate/glutamate antiporter SLC25A13, mitochondrial-like n=1 Tax=Sycon ciliatum TaxID=27933 RepID=UPI0020AE04CF|eukprot:scpid70945/ scgid34058/ Mitochondrial substrate carrier family protein X
MQGLKHANSTFRSAGDGTSRTNTAILNSNGISSGDKTNMAMGSASVPQPPMALHMQHSRTGSAAISMLSAGISQFVHHPMYTFKTHRQRRSTLSVKDFVMSARSSPGFLFKGVWPRSLGCMPEKMLKMQAYMTAMNIAEDRIKPTTERGKVATWAAAGCVAGFATTIAGCPAELLMVQAQTGNISVREFFRQRGLRGVYQGASVAVWRDVAFNMTFFVSRQAFISMYHSQFGSEPVNSAKWAVGVVAGMLAASASCPLDVVKTRMQEKDASRRNWPALLVRIARKEGVGALFHGLGPRCLAVPSMMSFFALLHENMELYFFGETVLKH